MNSLFEQNEVEEVKRELINPLNNLNGKEWVFSTNSIESFVSTEDEREFNRFVVELIESKFSTNGKNSYAHHIRKIHPSPKPPQLMEKTNKIFF